MSTWPRKSLAELASSIDYGHTASATPDPVGPKFLRITDIRDGALVDWAKVPYCSASTRDEAEAKLQAGDIVFARTGATTGKSYLIRDCPERAVFASYLIRVRLSSNVVPEYLAQFFRTPDYWRQVGQNSTGTAQAGVNASNLARLSVPVPPLDEQRRIAAVLDQADSLQSRWATRSVFLASLAESAYHRSFAFAGDRLRTVQVGSIATSIRTGPFGSQLLHSEFVDEGVAVLGIDNVVQNRFVWGRPRFITKRKYEQLARYRVFPGDVLITIMATCGRCAVVPEGIGVAINTKHICCVTPDRSRCLPEFLRACLLFDREVLAQLGVRERGAVMPGLNMSIIQDLRIPLPPLDAQQRFVTALDAISRLESEQRDVDVKGREMFEALQAEIFRSEG